MTEVEKHLPIHETIDELDEEQPLQTSQEPSWSERAQKAAVRASSTWLGQFAIRQGDRLLWTIEKTAKWGCPLETAPAAPAESKKAKDKSTALVRPLPWLLFLPALVALRLTRITLSLCSILVGYKSIAAGDLVTFVQSARRKMRAIKYQGLRNIRLHEAELRAHPNGGQTTANATKLIQSILDNILRGVCMAPARPIEEDEAVRVVVKKKSKGKSALDVETNKKAAKRDRSEDEDTDSAEDELKLLLAKSLAESDSEDGSFELDLHELEESSSSGEGSTSENDEIVGINEKKKNAQSAAANKNNDQRADTETNGETNEITNGSLTQSKASSQTGSSDSGIGHQNNKYQNGSLSDDGKSSSDSHETNKEFKRTDSASLTNYSKTNGDGAGGDGLNNDDTFYSPIGSPTPDNAKSSNEETPITNDRDNKHAEVSSQSQQQQQQQQHPQQQQQQQPQSYYASNDDKSGQQRSNNRNRNRYNNGNSNGYQASGGRASATNGSRNSKKN